MKTSVTGFPRIGKERELKWAEEKYFRNEISAEELFKIARILKREHWGFMKDADIDFIPSNDFSLYDNMLDTAVMLNVIPERYERLKENEGITETDVYFAMARGYQGEAGDVPALAMKKWFNTNYHYIVPEFEQSTKLCLNSEKLLSEFKEALDMNIRTKPCVIGPFTFLKLSEYTGEKCADDYAEAVTDIYIQLFKEISAAGAEWIQLDEPSLVCDITDEERQLFNNIYKRLLGDKGALKILLNTYFGDIRDCYEDICALDADGIGLDFIEGSKNTELIKGFGFPEEKMLFAGIVNGKNVRKCDYKKAIGILNEIKPFARTVAVSSSCSLLHVPYTLKNERSIDEDKKERFSFALEKLVEIRDIASLAQLESVENESVYFINQNVIERISSEKCEEVREAVNKLTDENFTRNPERKEREKIQKEKFAFPILPTTTIGSFPQTAEVKANRSRYKKGEIGREEYDARIHEFINDCIKQQEAIGLDVLVHGEFERNDMVEFFGESLDGFIFTDKAWVQSYGTRCVKPPIIYGDIKRKKSITTEYIKYAASLTDKPVKGMLTGPVTILNWSFPREDISLKEMAYQIALAIKEEVHELETVGIEIIQIDEAALREKLPLRKVDRYVNYLEWAIKAFRLCHSDVKPGTQIHTHMCYSEFEDIIKEIDDMDADVISFEASRSDMKILDSLSENEFETQVGPGVYDIHSPRIPSVEEIKDKIERILEKTDINKVWVNPDCGLKTRTITETKAALKNMVVAARQRRK